jgi:hypothetical protein
MRYGRVATYKELEEIVTYYPSFLLEGLRETSG